MNHLIIEPIQSCPIPLLMRTFRLQLEISDVIKKQVLLPEGYQWSTNTSYIVNTTGKPVSPSGQQGGVLLTKPLHLARSDVRQLRSTLKACFDNNGVLLWNAGFYGQLAIGDLSLPDLKKLFSLSYYLSGFINEVFQLGEWSIQPHIAPVPDINFKLRVDAAKSLEALKDVFSNSSIKGHYPFQINIMLFLRQKP